MIFRLLIAGSLLWLATLASRAQSAEDFFNGGAQFYISNNIPEALQKVQAGRKIYPEDDKLKKLEELLKQQQQNQQNQQNQKNQSQQKQNSQNQQSQSQQQQQQQKNQSNPQNQQQNQSQQQQAQNQNPGQQQQQAMAMTPEEAKRLLDSQKGNEQVLQFNSKNQPQNQIPPVKDW
jgi:Ca-activated chloride channel homolog